MKGEELGKLLLDGLLVAENGRWLRMTVLMLALSASMFWLMVTWCSWVSSQYASNRAIRSCTWSSSVVEGLIGSSSWDSCGGGG